MSHFVCANPNCKNHCPGTCPPNTDRYVGHRCYFYDHGFHGHHLETGILFTYPLRPRVGRIPDGVKCEKCDRIDRDDGRRDYNGFLKCSKCDHVYCDKCCFK